MFRLKNGQDTFTVVDGPDAGKTFQRGMEYEAIPPGEGHRFEKVAVPTPRAEPAITPDPKPTPKKGKESK